MSGSNTSRGKNLEFRAFFSEEKNSLENKRIMFISSNWQNILSLAVPKIKTISSAVGEE